MQKFIFPMSHLRVTQGELDSYSHAGSLAMDFGGKDSGADRLFAPCDMVVKRCRANATGEMYLESLEKVQFADGTSDYARLLCIHDAAFNKKAGDIVKQGEYFYDEGGMGSGKPNKFATHVHIEAGKGKWKSTTQSPNSKGTYVCENQAHLYDMFFIPESTVILDDGGYKWVKEKTQQEKDLEAEVEFNRAYKEEIEKLKAELAQANRQLAAERASNEIHSKELAQCKDKLVQIKNIVGG